MRLREAHVPILLWIITAAALHWGGAEQSDQIAKVQAGKKHLRDTVSEAVPTRDEICATGVRVLPDGTLCPQEVDFDFTVDQPASTTPPQEQPIEAAPTNENDPTAKPDETKPEDLKKDKTPEKIEKKKDEPKPPEPPKPEPKKVEPKKELPPMVAETMPQPPKEEQPPPPLAPEKKISVIQNQKEDEDPNPEAHYLAEKNHKVDPADETHAQITSTTSNDPNPTPGTSNGGPSDKVGNADKTVIAQDEDRPGEKVAPNVVPKTADAPKLNESKDNAGTAKGNDKPIGPDKAAPKVATATNPPPPQPDKSDGKGLKTPPNGSSEIASGTGDGPTVKTSPSANPNVAKPSPVEGNGDGKKKIPESLMPKVAQGSGGKWVSGLDGSGPSGLGKLAIKEKDFKAAVGMDELDRLKKVDAETKLSLHRGAWKSSSLERWRSAIENYTPGVKPGNQTNLGTAAAPWATYLAQIHVRMHPIFADDFVDSLDDLPKGHPLNDQTLVTRMEIVLKPDGTIDHLGIVKPSGVTAFDIAALDSVDRAAPFGKAPTQIVSPDGLVYLHWEFHRDEMRCSNLNAYPYLLKGSGAPPVTPEPVPTPKPTPNPEDGKKYGALLKPKG
jgi:hypothetical protein